jgi:ribonucleoside-diphosphate reductase alpha chain
VETVVALNEEDAIARADEHFKIYPGDTWGKAKKIPVKAKDLWNTIWTNAVKSGDPGIYNISYANKFTNVSYFEELKATNPCGEISLPSYGNCCLGHVNLANMVVDGEVDWKRLARAIRTGIRFLDNVLTVNHFPVTECKEVAHKSRRIGLGVMGLHYMLIKLNLLYGKEESLEFIERLFATIRNEAYKASCYLSREKGPFNAFDAKKYLKEEFSKGLPARIRMMIKEHGIRNAVMLTIAPTGTTAMVHSVSTGLEPIFSAIYKRRYREGNVKKEIVVVDPLFKEHFDNKLPLEYFVGAYEVTPREHMAVQAACQKYIDSCISKTINLPEDADAEGMLDEALRYASDLKGMTIYRSGSKGKEPLEAIPLTKENIEKYVKGGYDIAAAGAEACSLNGGNCG